ncbi:MAG TPA: TIGR02281 family clan AA aspartic protease [Zoogloea sp.]|uniref:retropepsin-like aspartic protease family protein n=1 Tax=Zoogloea sp. TaxID=49181 RepID=UPI002B85A75C|nr:TIGR02281 family clan AA aspartic protease [Zoogloea sp.]HMV18484.1 TIGR02281 family clan AA aspartic protease [Rhodocyclaceae bacterium]HMV64489.1 TIGR02281 family clan AA aspartic protease [Rhodocyclaceae bacterium]HMY48175.1 TIGR02281 family clan AA aspartic protease [Rhodocyclaceae bacterium]HND24887.1 TIGR02281 family clan AA aspartic protease [Rhodocyclaceae bacterium]HNH17155.1 TIGR02281 family clan AA aspartic protease [Zoogloea sp.]
MAAMDLAQATDVVLAGVFPGKALLVIDGRAPRAVASGAMTPEGVRVITVEGDAATVEVDGRRQRLVVGQSAVRVGGETSGGGTVELQADRAGHFLTYGTVNGAQVNFLVDTGASLIVLGRSDAIRAGIDYKKGEPAQSITANGVARTWIVMLDSVRVGNVTQRNVRASIHGEDLPVALLGMSFLNRMEMRRDNGVMTLKQRY